MMRVIVMFLSAFLLWSCGGEKTTHVVFETELGQIDITLYPERAPLSVRDFLYYVDNGLYDGEGFYRSVRPETDPLGLGMEIIQGGLLGMEAVTASIDHETTKMSGLSHTHGAISIARDEPGTGSAAYFFICIGDNTFLDYGGTRNPDGQGYAVFGQIVKGMDVVRAIQMRDTGAVSNDAVTQGQILSTPVKIIKARRR